MRYHSPLMSYRVQIIATSWMSCEIIILMKEGQTQKATNYTIFIFMKYPE